MGCLICGRVTQVSFNKSVRVLCEECISLCICEEDKKTGISYSQANYYTYCDNCFAEYTTGFFNFCVQLRKRLRGVKSVCRRCRGIVNQRPKKYICWRCGEKTRYKRKLCLKCFDSFIHPDYRDGRCKQDLMFVFYCEQKDCKDRKQLMPYSTFNTVLQRKSVGGYVYRCAVCGQRSKGTEKDKVKKIDKEVIKRVDFVRMFDCILIKAKSSESRDEYCLLRCPHRRECRDRMSRTKWDAWKRKGIEDEK